ncbi:MAG: hypothetical protein C0417_07745, partial [Chlorobiaceae bacterium]|nr:hypothetical protein [Chlorobiaceae bacterium]
VIPTSLDTNLYTGEQATKILTIENNGASDLTFEISVQEVAVELKVITKTEIAGKSINYQNGGKEDHQWIKNEKIINPYGDIKKENISDYLSSNTETKFNTLISRTNTSSGERLFGALSSQISEIDLTTGGVISSFPTPVPTSDGPTALAFSGVRLYFTDAFNTSKIFVLDPSIGTVLDSFPAPSMSIDGLAFVNGKLYAMDYTAYKIYELNPDGGMVLRIISPPVYIGGGIDGGDGRLFASNFSSGIFELSLVDGSVINSFIPVSDVYGLAFTGRKLFTSVPGIGIDEYDPNTGTYLGRMSSLGFAALAGGSSWLLVNPSTGTISSGSSIDITVVFDATGMNGGDYNANVLIKNNDPDPDQDTVIVPAHLHVTGAPDIALSDTSIDYDTVFIGVVKRETLRVSNVGTDVLNVGNITSDNSDYGVSATNFSLNPGEHQNVAVTFTPSVVGERLGKLTITSDDPDEGTLEVDLVGVGIEPPNIVVTPTSLNSDLLTGEIETKTLTISNTAQAGSSDLHFNVALQMDGTLSADKLFVSKKDVTVPLGTRSGEIPPGTEYHPNQVIVKFKRGVQTAQAMTIRSEIDATVEKKFKMIGAELWNVSGVSVTDVISRYRGNPLIEYVEPNYVVRAIDKIPNDPYFSSLWGMQKIQAPAAWDKTTGNDVLIGVIDTGVDPDHVDLAANIWTNPGEIAGNGIDDDGNGYIDDIHGWDFYNNDNNPYDDNGHGTHVSGTIAASGNNGIGVVGVCWSAKIMGLKFLSSGGSGYTSGAISALEYATMMNVRLTSNSWGGGGYEQALYDAIQAAGAAGDLFIAAAGNSSLNNDSYPHYPSSYVLDNVISVASTTSDDQMSWFSNYGLVSVDLGAPGSDIYSTLPGNNYGSYSGTSMATPHVSGVAGLILSLNSNLGWADVKGILMSTVDPISALAGKCVTGGRLNANNAVQSVQTWLSVNPMSGTVAAGNSVELQVTFDATGLNGGDYVGNILVLNNDPTPDEDTISVSALLHVTGAPDIALSDTSIDFGTAFISITHRDTLTVSNVGTDVLNVSNITSDNSDYGVSVTNFSLNPGEHQNVAVTFTPSVVGERLGKLTITSDDPDEGTLEVNLIGVGVEPPNIVVTPTSLDTSLYTGEQATKILTIENNGASNLTFDVSVKGVSGLTSMNYIPNESLKSTKVLAIGKPIPMDKLKDMPKVMSVNSNDLIDKGKSFQHNPSTANPSESIMGVEIFGSMENIYYAGPRTRGNLFSCMTSTKLIEHRFYLNPSASTQLWFLVYEGNTQVGTYNLISASNVTPAGPGEGWYSSGMVEVSLEAGKYYLIVASFEQVSNYYNQQNIIPYPISTSFGQLTAGAGWGWAPSTSFPPANSQDVPSGAFSGPVAYYQAIVTGVGTSWLSVNPTSGVVPPSTSMNIEVTFDATGMNGGDYYADILIKNNDPDPDQDTVIVPAHLHVTGAPDMALSDTTFDYGTLFIGASKQETLRVSNAGTDVLNVSNIASNNSDYNISATNFSLNPGEHQNVVVTFTPSVVGERLGTLTITSDDPDEGTLEVDLVGVGIEPPNIVVSPASLDTSLNTGHQTTKILTIENNGASNLYFNISLASTSGSLASTQINIYTLPPIKIDASKNIDLDKSINNNSVFPNPDLHTRNITAELKDLTGKFIGITNLYYYYVISNDLQNRGALIREIVFPISQTTLDSMDVLFIDDAIYYATPSDISNIRNWVQEGNALIIHGDDYSSMSNINTLLPGTGIQVTSLNNYYSAILTNILPHEITKYVDTINADSYGSYCTIISPAQTIVYDDYGRTHVAFSNLGLGKVAAVGNEFCSDWNLTVGDTRLFANQMVDWSVGGSDFLSVVPDSGTISPGNLSNVSITFDATGMNGGDYYADILIKNNDPDPDQDTVIVPAHLHVTGTPEFSLLPTSLSYGSVNFGTGKVDSVVVTNIGSSQLDITSVVSDNEQFTVTPTSAILAPSVPTKFYITFTPSNNGTIIGNIIFSHNALGTPDTVVVSGNGIGPVFVVSKNVVDFGSVLLGYVKKDSVRVSNLGLTSLSISSVTCNNSQVTILPENSVISPWSSRWFVITFTSTSMGELSGAIIFTHNAPSSPDTATVAGRAVQSIQISVVNRWNIVSVPISGTDPRKNILFPMAISPAYKYKEKYISSDSMFHGSGYWLKFDSSYRIQFNGFILADDTIDVVSGWNMIGSISTPIDVSNVIPHETNIMSPLFGYHNGYDMTDSLHPGSAYWVKMSDPGKLVLTSREQSSMMRSVSYAKLFDELDRLQFEDYLGNKQSVFFSMDEKNTELKKFSDAPPLPPSGCFDVRYQSQRIAEVFSTSEKYRDFTIMITDATYPMKVRWNIKLDKGHQFILYDAPNGKRIHHTLSAETGDVIISDKRVNRIVLRIAQIPTQFVMLQNYPNPFNPITKIEYALPTDSKVSIKIFNLLGQEVKTLIEEEQDAGYKICEFDASEFTSGVYFYRVTAQSVGKTYSDVKKMLLLK